MKPPISHAIALLALVAGSAFAANTNSFIVTAEGPNKSAPAPSLTAHDIIARVDNQPAAIASWHALRDDQAGLELWIMIDDGTDSGIGIQFDDIRNFIHQQPPETKVAIGYLRNGSVQTAQKPTADHGAAMKAIRLPSGIGQSLYRIGRLPAPIGARIATPRNRAHLERH
jgi:hypothetical protein